VRTTCPKLPLPILQLHLNADLQIKHQRNHLLLHAVQLITLNGSGMYGIITLNNISHISDNYNKMLSYRRETMLQGAL